MRKIIKEIIFLIDIDKYYSFPLFLHLQIIIDFYYIFNRIYVYINISIIFFEKSGKISPKAFKLIIHYE